MRTQTEREATTVTIFAALLLFAAIVLLGVGAMVLAHWCGAPDLAGPRIFGVLVGVAGASCIAYVARSR